MTQWFGDSWGAPMCDPEFHTETPVGLACNECGAVIVVGDQGITMAFVGVGGEPGVVAYHIDCWLAHVLPHGPDCPRCRGLERSQHKMSCNYAKHGSDCNCPFGDDMRRVFDSTTTLADLAEMAERIGISRAELEDIGRRGVEHVRRLKRIRDRRKQ